MFTASSLLHAFTLTRSRMRVLEKAKFKLVVHIIAVLILHREVASANVTWFPTFTASEKTVKI